jgi:hypothetical protein
MLQEWSDPQQLDISERAVASGAGKSTYEVAWTCDMDLTKSGMRGEVVLDVAVRDFGVVTLPILVRQHAAAWLSMGSYRQLGWTDA